MARTTGRSGFKMKSSPNKIFGNFFRGLSKEGTEARQEKQRTQNKGEYEGMTNFEKRRAEKKSRKAGESKFQADIRRKREVKKAKRADVKSDYEYFKKHREAGTTPGTPIKPEKEVVVNEPESKQTFKQAKEKKTNYDYLFDIPFNPNVKYDKYDEEGNPIIKKSPSKKRGYKMNRKNRERP